MICVMTAHARTSLAFGQKAAPVTSGPTSVAELLRRSGRGDETAFAELYDQTCSRVFGLVSKVVLDLALSEAVTQQVYLHLWRHSARFDPDDGSAVGWINTIAYRAAVAKLDTLPLPRPA